MLEANRDTLSNLAVWGFSFLQAHIPPPREKGEGGKSKPAFLGRSHPRVGLQSAQGLLPGWPRPARKDYSAAVYPEDSRCPDPKSVGNGFKI